MAFNKLVDKERVIMFFPGYLPTFPASILEPLLNISRASYMSVITYKLPPYVAIACVFSLMSQCALSTEQEQFVDISVLV